MNEIECETCIKRKTMYCPNSSECFNTTDKIYYQNRIMALEGNEELVEKNLKLQNNWNELKKYISAEWYCFDNESVEFEVARKIMKKAQELEQGKDENN